MVDNCMSYVLDCVGHKRGSKQQRLNGSEKFHRVEVEQGFFGPGEKVTAMSGRFK